MGAEGTPALGSPPLLALFLAFLCGALPLSLWLGRLALGVDIRSFGDGNPGATNVWRAGGPRWGLLAIALDAGKGLLAAWLARDALGAEGLALAALCLAPILGHAFSPFLRFQGGKALAVSFGVWTGLTLWLGPLAMGLGMAIGLLFLEREGWAVLLGQATLAAALLWRDAPPAYLALAAAQALLLAWTHRADLARLPRLRRPRPAGNNRSGLP